MDVLFLRFANFLLNRTRPICSKGTYAGLTKRTAFKFGWTCLFISFGSQVEDYHVSTSEFHVFDESRKVKVAPNLKIPPCADETSAETRLEQVEPSIIVHWIKIFIGVTFRCRIAPKCAHLTSRSTSNVHVQTWIWPRCAPKGFSSLVTSVQSHAMNGRAFLAVCQLFDESNQAYMLKRCICRFNWTHGF